MRGSTLGASPGLKEGACGRRALLDLAIESAVRPAQSKTWRQFDCIVARGGVVECERLMLVAFFSPFAASLL
jgi:hypothetical protein